MTVHRDRFGEHDFVTEVEAYDRRRKKAAPYRGQRDVGIWGQAPEYGWSEEKSRHYAQPQRREFGNYVRNRGFSTTGRITKSLLQVGLYHAFMLPNLFSIG